jgi:hypothetical protein
MRDMSGSGPFGPILKGVWQSLHDMMVTRYFPRSIFPAATLDCPAGLGWASPEPAGNKSTRNARAASVITTFQDGLDHLFFPPGAGVYGRKRPESSRAEGLCAHG